MSTTVAVPFVAARRRPPMLPLFAREIRYELLKLLRRHTFSLATIGFPVMFYLLFGVTNRHAGDGSFQIAKYLLAGYSAFGVVGAALFGVGVGLATERAAGWLDLKRSSPMPPAAYLLAKCATAVVFGLVICTILIGIGTTLAGVHLTALEAAKLLATTAAGAVPFAAMGLVLALVVPASATPGIINLVYLPMSFCSGLWMPLAALPHWLQSLAPALPTYHLAQLMLGIFAYGQPGSTASHWEALAGFTLLMLGIAWLVFQRAEQRS